MELVRHRSGEYSNGRVILARSITAASLCSIEQLLNRLTEGRKKRFHTTFSLISWNLSDYPSHVQKRPRVVRAIDISGMHKVAFSC
jgi:hypothetical protein